MNGRNVAAALSVIESAPLATPSDDGVSAFLRARPRLFGIAYRMLGSVAEAEDIVQDVWVRWQTTDRSRVRNPPAFLAAVTARLAINVLQSARARREGSYASQCLTEPIDTSADPTFGTERAEALRFAVLLLLERLSPTERAAYVLREAFNYPYRKIADILRMKEPNVRQVVTRARVHVSGRRRAPVRSTSPERLFNAFAAASRTGDLTGLERLLVSDVISNSEKRCDHSLEAFDNLVVS
jgi:RNA polymerase sigma factor (sigma-70 family)